MSPWEGTQGQRELCACICFIDLCNRQRILSRAKPFILATVFCGPSLPLGEEASG